MIKLQVTMHTPQRLIELENEVLGINQEMINKSASMTDQEVVFFLTAIITGAIAVRSQYMGKIENGN